MYLKALEIQGFKSFPDKTRITFDEGFTAVVGPNGSGKSNISDAIRWVLGETSAKQLRGGGGKMEGIIFDGTETRKPMGYASVQLVLDNKDRRLDIDDDEVTIGRKYYRSGEGGDYSINGQAVRLKDVREVLLDTGLGRDGYAIIGQGRIAQIVEARSDERREIFEEASGIARYRYRKNTAETDLAAAEEKLVRARDILEPMEERLGPLELKSQKAQKYLELKAERKQLEVTLWVETLRTTREKLRGQQRKIEIATSDYNQKQAELDKLDEADRDNQEAASRINIDIDETNRAIRTLQEDMSTRSERVAVLRNNIQHNAESIEENQREIEESGNTVGELEAQITHHKEEITLAEQRLAHTQEKITALEGKLEEIRRKSQAVGERRGQVQARLTEITTSATHLQVNEARAESAIASGKTRLEELEKSLTEAAESLERLVADRADTRAYISKLEADLTRLGNITGGLEMKLEARRKALAGAEENERAVQREADAARQRVHMLKELERSLDGFQHSTKSVVKAARDGKLRGIVGPVSTLLSVQPGYEVAIETVLGYALQNVVVEDESAAKAAMSYLKQTKGGRCTFLPLDTVKPRRFDASRLPEGAISAKSVVKYDPRFENIVSSMLEQIVVVEGLNDVSRVARALDFRNRVVSLDGQIANPGGSFTGGSASRTTGLFSRKQEITDLEQKLGGMEQKQQQAAEATQNSRAEVDTLAAELKATESESITLQNDKRMGDAELERIEKAAEAGEELRARRAGECDTLAAQIEADEAALKSASRQQAELAAEMEALSAELAGIAGEDDSFLSENNALSKELTDLQMDAMGRQHDVETHRQYIENLRSRSGESAARRESLQANIDRMKAENTNYEVQIEAVDREAAESKTKISELEQKIRDLTAQRMELEKAGNEHKRRERTANEEREGLGREIERLTSEKNRMDERYDGTVNQLWDEYQLGPTEAEKLCVAFDSLNELERQVMRLRKQISDMGAVDEGAIEEYRELKARCEEMRAKVDDVEASKAKLEAMIAELSAEMTQIFASKFELINQNFKRVFSELFGGGRGTLRLSDPDNLLESGIDIEAAPPGKDIKFLGSLSGGEQSLVAICIYFAILAVNPSPFCVLDEIEAALDDVNVNRFARYLRGINAFTQFIVITHRRGTMEAADVLYGVTQEDGVSKMLRLNAEEVDVTMVQ